MTISILPAYRRRGIGKQLLNHIIGTALKDTTIIDAYLHVQTSNEDAKEFYIAHGFEETETIRNYYKRIEPPGKKYDVIIFEISALPLFDSLNELFIFIFAYSQDCYVLKKKLREVS